MSGKSMSSVLFLVVMGILTHPASSDIGSFVYGGCSKYKFSPDSDYKSNLNTLLGALVNSATFNPYGNYSVDGSGGSSNYTIEGLFQCRGDLNSQTCSQCVSNAVSRLGVQCSDAVSGSTQLEGCLVKYGNRSLLGQEDKTLMVKKCGPITAYDDLEGLTKRDEVLGQLVSQVGAYRVVDSGKVQGMSQCLAILDPSQCQDCVAEAIDRVQKECGPAKSGDAYLASCYVRFVTGGSLSRSKNNDQKGDDETQKTIAIIIGLIAGVILLIVFLSFLGKQFRRLQEGGKHGC